MKKINIAIISENKITRFLKHDLEDFNLVEIDYKGDIVADIISSNIHVCILDIHDKLSFIKVIRSIRRHADTYLLPVFCTNENFVEYSAKLYTGANDLFKFKDLVEEEYNSIIDIENVNFRISSDWILRLLIYLYTVRNFRDLDAHRSMHSTEFYTYPLIDVFCNDREFDKFEWVKELEKSGILKAKELVKSYFGCGSCSSAHILYSERCPECKSEDFVITNFLHCYKCGNIAPEDEFIKANTYVCSNCNSDLKHLGKDYDRPLESYTCNSCKHISVEASVTVDCFKCNSITPTQNLIKNTIYNYTLTKKAIDYMLDCSLNVYFDSKMHLIRC
jgi:ribosomal protein S26